MKFEKVWLFYRSNRAIAQAANVSDQAVSLWKKKGIVPLNSALELNRASSGALKVNYRLYLKPKAKTG